MGLLAYSYPARTNPSHEGRFTARHSTPTWGTTTSWMSIGRMIVGAGGVGGLIPAGQPPCGGGTFSTLAIFETGGTYALQFTHVRSTFACRSSVGLHDAPATACCGKNASTVSVW